MSVRLRPCFLLCLDVVKVAADVVTLAATVPACHVLLLCFACSRAIGRIAGQGGKTRHAIENATRTRIVVADQKVHILGSFSNIKVRNLPHLCVCCFVVEAA